MAVMVSPAQALAWARTDLGRQAIRARNGIKYVAGIGRPQVGQTPKDVVWRRDRAELWRYRSDRAGNPAIYILVLQHISSGVGWGPGPSRDGNLPVFVAARFHQLLSNFVELQQQFAPLRLQLFCVHFKGTRVGPRQSFRD